MRQSRLSFFISTCCTAAWLMAADVAPAQARSLPHAGQIVVLSVVDQDLADVLVEVGSQVGVRVSVSPTVAGRVHGRLPEATTDAALDRLGRMFGFEWYFDGETVYVSALSESGSRLLNLGSVDSQRLAQALDQLGIADPRWPIRNAEGAGLGMVAGPPRYLALVEQTLAALPHRTPEGIRIFRGSLVSSAL